MLGVIIRETEQITALAEIKESGHNVTADLYEDEYSVRLTRKPNGTVMIDINSIAVASDRRSNFTPAYRNYDKRRQVYVDGMLTQRLTFNEANWYDAVTVRVSAIDDEYEEGVDWLNFASQPSNLVRIIIEHCFSLPISGGRSLNL